MIQPMTMLNVADNSGARKVQCIRVLGGTRKRYAYLGDIIVVTVKVAEPRKTVKKHEINRAVIVRQRKPFRRPDGTYVSFSDNAVVILGSNKDPKGGRILGPIAREIKENGFDKITNLAQEVV